MASDQIKKVLSTKGQDGLPKAAPLFPATTIDEVVGILRHAGKPLSLKDMDVAVAAEAKRRARD